MEICKEFNASQSQVTSLIEALHERCIVEPKQIREAINVSDFRRVLNFIGDYYPALELFATFERLSFTNVVILGCGAVGSWTAIQLAHSGIQNFTIIDSDIVEESNLNRSLYHVEDIGQPKVRALESAMHRISPTIHIRSVCEKISEKTEIHDALMYPNCPPSIMVNCADEPSVDVTSDWVNRYCLEKSIPYVIAGGYNLHLSLIGMTVIPGASACFKCSRITLEESSDESLLGVRRLWRPKRNLGSIAPLTGITSALATTEVLRLALRSERLAPVMLNRRGEFNFLTNELLFADLPPREECGCMEAKSYMDLKTGE